MNFYAFHIGDYASATGHLTLEEDLFLRRLLDRYYVSEQPLPADLPTLCRLVCAATPKQRATVERVLREFFSQTEAGWRNKRCDEEIAKAAERRELAAKSARTRWETPATRAPARDAGRNAASRAAQAVAETAPAMPPPARTAAADADPHAPTHAHTHANAMPTHSECIASALPMQCPGNANALPAQCEGNAPNPNPYPIPNTTTTTTEARVATSPAYSPGGAPVVVDARWMQDDDGLPLNPTQAAPPGTPIPDPPRSVGDWCNFFARLGFAGKQLRKLETRGAMQSWAARGLTQGAMRAVMLNAHECNNGQPPMSPLYYATFIDDWFSRGGKLRISLRSPPRPAGAAPHPLDAALRAMQPPAEPRPPIEPI